jgi:hypothetical protein
VWILRALFDTTDLYDLTIVEMEHGLGEILIFVRSFRGFHKFTKKMLHVLGANSNEIRTVCAIIPRLQAGG